MKNENLFPELSVGDNYEKVVEVVIGACQKVDYNKDTTPLVEIFYYAVADMLMNAEEDLIMGNLVHIGKDKKFLPLKGLRIEELGEGCVNRDNGYITRLSFAEDDDKCYIILEIVDVFYWVIEAQLKPEEASQEDVHAGFCMFYNPFGTTGSNLPN